MASATTSGMTSLTPSAILSPQRTPNRAPMQPNVANVLLGNLLIKPWYPSFYPEDLVGGRKIERLHVCQWCFKYTSDVLKYSAHSVSCFDPVAPTNHND